MWKLKTVTIGCLAVLCASVLADTLSVPVDNAVIISGRIDGKDRSRILLKFTMPETLRSASVDHAGIIFDNPAKLMRKNVTIHARPITTAWDPDNVRWDYPWLRPGGDFDSTQLYSYSLRQEDSLRAMLDFTDDVHSWQSGRDYNGTIIMRPAREGGGFGAEVHLLRALLQQTRVRFYFTGE